MLEVVQAAAGTRKTTALSAARLGWEAAGYRVLGSSTAARAARELADGAGIAESKTLARLLGDLEHDVHGGFAAGTVLVVNEAGMVGSRVLQRLLEVEQRDQTKSWSATAPSCPRSTPAGRSAGWPGASAPTS